MVSKKCRKNVTAQWKLVRRCTFFTITICVIPVLLVFMITSEQYVRSINSGQAYGRSEVNNLTIRQFDHIDYDSESGDWSKVEARFEERNNYLKKKCHELGLDKRGDDPQHTPYSWEYLVNKQYHLVWCNVFKAASTSWLYNFNILAGYDPSVLADRSKVPVALARKKYPRPSVQELEDAIKESLSFIIVRHPLERLLSAYRDKIEFSLPRTFHQRLGAEIVMKYRKKEDRVRLRNQKWPSFNEFVLYLFDEINKNEPLDMHWTPITTFCTPCMFNFTVIAHTETLMEDQNYIIYKAGLEGKIKPEWKNKGRSMTAEQIQPYYSQLTRSQIQQLYDFFWYDFELFNYSLNGYIEFGKPDDEPLSLLPAINLNEPSN